MKTNWPVLILAALAVPALAQTKWEPYRFKGNEKYEFKIVTEGDDEARKEVFYTLDVRQKGDESCEVTWSTKTTVKKADMTEKLAWGAWGAEWAMAWVAMNPIYAAVIKEVDLEEGSKMSLFGAGTVKVTKKDKVGGRTGFICQWYSKKDDKEVLDAEWTIDPDLALPIRCVTFEDGKEKSRVELLTYTKS